MCAVKIVPLSALCAVSKGLPGLWNFQNAEEILSFQQAYSFEGTNLAHYSDGPGLNVICETAALSKSSAVFLIGV